MVGMKKEVLSMLDNKVRDLINEQVTKEFYSAYLYLDFANYYQEKGLDGFAHWFDIQAQEERDHAMLMRHLPAEQRCSRGLRHHRQTGHDLQETGRCPEGRPET